MRMATPATSRVLITNVNSRFKTLDDVFKNTQDVTLGFGDPNSTSGTLIPAITCSPSTTRRSTRRSRPCCRRATKRICWLW